MVIRVEQKYKKTNLYGCDARKLELARAFIFQKSGEEIYKNLDEIVKYSQHGDMKGNPFNKIYDDVNSSLAIKYGSDPTFLRRTKGSVSGIIENFEETLYLGYKNKNLLNFIKRNKRMPYDLEDL